MTGVSPRVALLQSLRQFCRGTNPAPASAESSRISTGIPSLDAILPERGYARGSLIEWLVPGEGSGAALLALQGIRAALRSDQVWAVVDPAGEFYPPALVGWGIAIETLLLLRPSTPAETAWAVEQCLRSPAVGVLWLEADITNDLVVQRWKRAVEVGGGLGILFRPDSLARQPSWADVRWRVRSLPSVKGLNRRIRVELLTCRGAFPGGTVELEVNDATGTVSLVSPLVDSMAASRPARAKKPPRRAV